jgi:hypothetical protein
MRLTAKFQVPNVNFDRFRQALHEKLSESLTEAAKQWLTAVVPVSTMEGIPVWSAASRATFSPLASYATYALALAPAGDAPDRVQLGLENGEATFEADRNTGIYRFSYSTTLPHLIINEYHNANTFVNPATGAPYFHLKRPGPYHFQEAGERAFRQFASTVELPGWQSIVDTTQLSVG